MINKLTKEQIGIAVEWWGNVICNPKHDNGDKSEQGVMATMLATMATTKITDEQKQIFGKELILLLEMESQFNGLHCDYGPDIILRKAMEKAEINSTNAPWKTNMNFQDGQVTVRYGYGAELQMLLKKS